MAAGVCRFGVLGPLALERDSRPVPLPSGRQRTLLALLLMAGGVPLSRDRLIDELWGEHPPASAVSALHVHLSKLRELLGDVLEREAAGYSLRSGDFELDCSRFDALVEQARSEPDRARVLLREALGLVRGDALCDVPAEGRIAQWRRALEEKCLQALSLRIDADVAAGAAGELVAELESAAAAHPFEERFWGQLMLALYRSGRQADALDAFAKARRAFATELGLEPGEQLVRLHTQILGRDASLLGATGNGAARAEDEPGRLTLAGPRASELPVPVTGLVARQPELAVLQGLLADKTVRVTLIGAGGVGKTRLSLELARRIEPDYRDGAVLVRLEQLTDPALVAAEIATALGHRAGTDGPGADGLARFLRDMELLLVIDNFEHLLAAAVLVSELREQAPRLQVLVTSRTALRIRGERLFTVDPLELPAGRSEDEIADSPAVQLFVERARATDPELQLDRFGEAYIDGRFEQAYEYACSSVERATEIGHSYMLICALEAQLLAGSALKGKIAQPELAEVFDLARRHGVHSVAVAAVWFVARYAAAVDPESARRWLALAERINTEYGAGPSLEDVLRTETMEVLGITDIAPLLSLAAPFDPATALDEVAAWVQSRSPAETAQRTPVRH